MSAVKIPLIGAIAATQVGSEWQVDFQLPEDYPYFDGHFPGNPLVPAFAQIGWLVAVVEAAQGAPLGAHRMVRLKFTRPIRPLEHVSVQVKCVAPKYRLAIYVGEALCGAGTLISEGDDV